MKTARTRKCGKCKKLEYREPEIRETRLDTQEATNYLTAIFVGTALAGCSPAKS